MIARTLAILLAAAAIAYAKDPYPDGSVTRTYTGTIPGTIAELPQTGKAEAEVTEIASTNGVATYRVRARFTEAPLLAGGIEGEWSNYIDAIATGLPFRAVASWADGSGRVYASPATNWTTIDIEATGTVVGFTAAVGPCTLTLHDTKTNALPIIPPDVLPPVVATTNGDAIALVEWVGLGTHAKQDLRRMAVTRTLYSASNEKRTCRLSFEPLNWSIGGDTKKVDGRVFILWRGVPGFTGGHFDWHGVGQTVKTQENIFAGYLDNQQPPPGAEVWYCIANREGTERTNIVPGGTW